MVKVKICGITDLGDAKAAVDAGYDALGFVFYKKSLRYIAPERAKEISKNLSKGILKVGVFVNAKEKEIKNIAELCKLDILQFHGKESPGFCRKFKGYKIIKAFRVNKKIDLAKILKYRTFACLFDTFDKQEVGGTGKRFNWKLIKNTGKIKRRIFLSGGLTAKNVKEAIKIAKPDWVDVSSSVESNPGKKDYKKVKEFIKEVKNA